MTESILNRVENATEEELFDLSEDVLQSVKDLIETGEFAQAFKIANGYTNSNAWPVYYEPMSYFEAHAKVVDFLFAFGKSCSSDLVPKFFSSAYPSALGMSINTNTTAETLLACATAKDYFDWSEGQLLFSSILLRQDILPETFAFWLEKWLFFAGEEDDDDESEVGSLARYLFGILSNSFPVWNEFMNNQVHLVGLPRSLKNLQQLLDHINSFDPNEDAIDWDEVMIGRDKAIALLESLISPAD